MSISFVPQIDISEMVLAAVIIKPYKTGVCSIYPKFYVIVLPTFRWVEEVLSRISFFQTNRDKIR